MSKFEVAGAFLKAESIVIETLGDERYQWRSGKALIKAVATAFDADVETDDVDYFVNEVCEALETDLLIESREGRNGTLYSLTETGKTVSISVEVSFGEESSEDAGEEASSESESGSDEGTCHCHHESASSDGEGDSRQEEVFNLLSRIFGVDAQTLRDMSASVSIHRL